MSIQETYDFQSKLHTFDLNDHVAQAFFVNFFVLVGAIAESINKVSVIIKRHSYFHKTLIHTCALHLGHEYILNQATCIEGLCMREQMHSTECRETILYILQLPKVAMVYLSSSSSELLWSVEKFGKIHQVVPVMQTMRIPAVRSPLLSNLMRGVLAVLFHLNDLLPLVTSTQNAMLHLFVQESLLLISTNSTIH